MDKGLKEKIDVLYREGKSYKEISNVLKCSKSAISYHCRKWVNRESKYTADKILVYQQYYDEGHTMREVAKKFGITRSCLTHRLVIRRRIFNKQGAVDNIKSYRTKVKEMAVEYKGGKCCLCGYKKCIKALDFHHVNPKEKDFPISGGTRSFENLKPELDKCILVCRNCHSEIHAYLHTDIYPHPDKV